MTTLNVVSSGVTNTAVRQERELGLREQMSTEKYDPRKGRSAFLEKRKARFKGECGFVPFVPVRGTKGLSKCGV